MRRVLNTPERHVAAESKDWAAVTRRIKLDLSIALLGASHDELIERLAREVAKKKELGERITRWAMYAARAFGIHSGRVSDKEAEVLLAALATGGGRRQAQGIIVKVQTFEGNPPRFYLDGERVLPADGIYELTAITPTQAERSESSQSGDYESTVDLTELFG